jgi:hypothetical protein
LMESAATFAAISGWPLIAAAALVLVAGALGRSPRQMAHEQAAKEEQQRPALDGHPAPTCPPRNHRSGDAIRCRK